MPEENLKDKTIKGVGWSAGESQLSVVDSFESTFDMDNVKDLMFKVHSLEY